MRTHALGKVLGALGLVLFLSSPYTFFITTGSVWLAAGKAALGVGLIGVFLATHLSQLGQFASKRSSFFFASSALLGVVLLGGVGTVNFIVHKKNKTWDLTQKKIFTLAPQTTQTLKGLKEKVHAIGFVKPDHPAYDAVKDLFDRYQALAPEKFDYAFRDPRRYPDLAAKYQLKEGQTTLVLTRGTGDGETHTALNVVSEQELTNALIKMNSVGEQKVYFTAGHGEWSLGVPMGEEGPTPDSESTSVSELKKTLLHEGYAPETLNLAGKAEVPKDASLVVVAGAKSRFVPPEVAALKKYLEEGGRVALFADYGQEAGLDSLLAEYGFELDRGVVADNLFGSTSPYVVLSMFFGEHEITSMLKQRNLTVEIPTARGITLLREGTAEGISASPVVLTSPTAWEESDPNEDPQPSSGEKSGQLTLAAASTRPTSSAPSKRFDEARLVVFGDSELILDGNWGHDPNRNLVMNALAWASTQINKITIRPPDRDISTLDVGAETMSKIRFIATDLLPLTLLGIGLAVWLARRSK